MKKKENDAKDNSRKENVRVGYQTAIQMWTHCGDEVWSRFNVMLVAHSIVVAVAGSALLKDSPFKTLAVVLSIAGILLCILWAIMTERAFAYQNYYLFCARKLEENDEVEPIRTISSAKDFKAVEEIIGFKEDSPLYRFRRWVHGNINAQKATYSVIVVFGLLYIALILMTI